MHIKHKLLITFGILAFLAINVLVFNYIYIDKVQEVEAPSFAFDYYLEEVEDEYFTGSYPVVSGYALVSKEAFTYVKNTIENFRKEAYDSSSIIKEEADDTEVKEGEVKESKTENTETENTTPISNYSINMGANYFAGNVIETVVIGTGIYTGGANGTSFYKTFSSFKNGEVLLSIEDIIKKDKQNDFVNLVKNKLAVWNPEDFPVEDGESPLFEDAVDSLSLGDLTSWAIDKDEFVLYFDEYQIGPGALGAISFPIPLSEVSNFLSF
ncbi:MAG: RsiV family protein [Candidatus Pacebacteria bacterium]|nr:RsiV family protein [Candidatus Paceibacterota bacterium]MCF7862732.1 RsiV family protein [Candidatus Paceibacterota bacterium]